MCLCDLGKTLHGIWETDYAKGNIVDWIWPNEYPISRRLSSVSYKGRCPCVTWCNVRWWSIKLWATLCKPMWHALFCFTLRQKTLKSLRPTRSVCFWNRYGCEQCIETMSTVTVRSQLWLWFSDFSVCFFRLIQLCRKLKLKEDVEGGGGKECENVCHSVGVAVRGCGCVGVHCWLCPCIH